MKFYWKVDVCIPALILNFGIGWNLAARFTHRSPYLRETPSATLSLWGYMGFKTGLVDF